VSSSESTLASVGGSSDRLVPLEHGGGKGDFGDDLFDLGSCIINSGNGIIGSIGSDTLSLLDILFSLGLILCPAIIISNLEVELFLSHFLLLHDFLLDRLAFLDDFDDLSFSNS